MERFHGRSIRGSTSHRRSHAKAKRGWHCYSPWEIPPTEGFGDPGPPYAGCYGETPRRAAKKLSVCCAEFTYASETVRAHTVSQVIAEQLGEAIAFTLGLVAFQAGCNDLIPPTVNPDQSAAVIEPAVDAMVAAGARRVVFLGSDSAARTVLEHCRSRNTIFNMNFRTLTACHVAVVTDPRA